MRSPVTLPSSGILRPPDASSVPERRWSCCVRYTSPALGDAGGGGVAPRERHHVGLVLDAQGTRAALCRGDHQAPVARAEVDDEVARRDAAEVEHFLGERGARRHPDDVLAWLAFVR